MGARVNGIHEVTGSIPVWSTTFRESACNELATDSTKGALTGAFRRSGHQQPTAARTRRRAPRGCPQRRPAVAAFRPSLASMSVRAPGERQREHRLAQPDVGHRRQPRKPHEFWASSGLRRGAICRSWCSKICHVRWPACVQKLPPAQLRCSGSRGSDRHTARVLTGDKRLSDNTFRDFLCCRRIQSAPRQRPVPFVVRDSPDTEACPNPRRPMSRGFRRRASGTW